MRRVSRNKIKQIWLLFLDRMNVSKQSYLNYSLVSITIDVIILNQFKLTGMLASIKKNGNKMKNSIVKAAGGSKRCIRRYRKPIIITVLILLALGLIAGLLLAAYQGVEITNFGVLINYTEERIINDTKNNEVNFIGINSNYFLVPKRKFLIYFDEAAPFDGAYWSPKLTARSLQGTKLIVSARVSCRIQLLKQKMKDFLEQYGLDWQKYVIGKTKNSIIQNIADTAFYDINNTLLLQKINTQFTNNAKITNYPFVFKVINLQIEYPANSFSSANSLGVRLLEEKSMYSQLTTNYKQLNNKMLNNIGEINSISQSIGATDAAIRMIQMQVRTRDNNWLVGLQILKKMLNDDQQKMRRFLWVYFQKVYNSTYNNYTFY